MKGFKLRRAIMLVLIGSCISAGLFAQESPVDPDTVESWKNTLRYGVDSSVIGSIDAMERAKSTELLPLLVELFPTSRVAVQSRIIDFATAMESDSLTAAIARELLFYQDIPGPTLIKMLTYLAKYPDSGNQDLEEVFVEISEGTNADQAAAAVRAMAAAGFYRDAAPLIALYESERVAIAVQNAVLVALADVGGEEAKDFLVGISEDLSVQGVLRQAAIESLGKIGGDDLLPLFRRLLQAEDPFTRTSVLSALGEAGYSGESIDQLYLIALRDNFWRVRLAVLKTLEKRVTESLFDIVVYIARNDPEVPVKTQAYRTLTIWETPGAIDVLAEDMNNARIGENYKLLILEYLAGKHFGRFRADLEKFIETEWTKPNSRILDTIARAMSTQNLPAAAGIFERFLGHQNIVIKIYGIRGIGNSHLGQYRDRITALSADSQPAALRNAARQALTQL